MENKKTTEELIKDLKLELQELNSSEEIVDLKSKLKKARKVEKKAEYQSQIEELERKMFFFPDERIDYYMEQFRNNIPVSGNLEKMSQEIHMIKQLLEMRWLKTREWEKVGSDIDRINFKEMLKQYVINDEECSTETEVIQCLVFSNRLAHHFEGLYGKEANNSKIFFYNFKSEMIQTILGRKGELEEEGVRLYKSVDKKDNKRRSKCFNSITTRLSIGFGSFIEK